MRTLESVFNVDNDSDLFLQNAWIKKVCPNATLSKGTLFTNQESSIQLIEEDWSDFENLLNSFDISRIVFDGKLNFSFTANQKYDFRGITLETPGIWINGVRNARGVITNATLDSNILFRDGKTELENCVLKGNLTMDGFRILYLVFPGCKFEIDKFTYTTNENGRVRELFSNLVKVWRGAKIGNVDDFIRSKVGKYPYKAFCVYDYRSKFKDCKGPIAFALTQKDIPQWVMYEDFKQKTVKEVEGGFLATYGV